MNSYQNISLANLDVALRPATQAKSPAVLMMHGYGANKYDLAPLADMMDPDRKYHWFFPNGILELILGPGLSGRAWFQIDVDEFEAAMREGRLRDLSKSRPEGFDIALQAVNSLYQEISDRHKQVLIGGFSQGAMLATELSFVADPRPEALVILSGALIDAEGWKSLSRKADGLRFLQTHGKNDALLSPDGARALNQILINSGLKGSLLEFSGGHEIPPPVIKRVGLFIHEVLK